MLAQVKDVFGQIESQLQGDLEGERTGNEFIEDEDGEASVNYRRIAQLEQLIEDDFACDKLKQYQEEVDEVDEQQLLNEYSKALALLKERYELECCKLRQTLEVADEELMKAGPTMPIPDQMLYLASSNHLQCMQRLQTHYPKLGRAVLQAVVDWIRKEKDASKRIGIHMRGWKEEFNVHHQLDSQSLQGKTEGLLLALMRDKVQKRQTQIQQLEIKQNRLKILEELEEKRIDFDERMKLKQQSEQQTKEEEQAEQRRRHEMWLSHKEEIDRVAAEYREAKLARQMEEEIKQQMIRQEQERKQQEQIQQSRPKVQQRQQREVDKLFEKINQKEANEYEKYQHRERIEQAVENYAFRPKPQFDSGRLVSETEARQLRKNTVYDKADKIPLSNVTGFNIQQLMGDMRYRLQTVLHEAGLGQAQYTKELIIGMRPPKQ